MARMISFTKHEVSGAYLNLDPKRTTEVVLNLDYLISAEYDPNYPNGYGDLVSTLELKTTMGRTVLYRTDAEEVWKEVKVFLEENRKEYMLNDGL